MYKVFLRYSRFVLFAGLVHRLSQLADLRAAAVGQCAVDDTQSAQGNDAFESIHSAICRATACGAIYIRHGSEQQ